MRTRHSMYLGDFGDDAAPGDELAMGPASTGAQSYASDWASPYAQTQVYPTPTGEAPALSNIGVASPPPPPQVMGSTSSPPMVAAQPQSTTAGGFLTGITSGITSFFGPAKPPLSPYGTPYMMQQQTSPLVWVAVAGIGAVALILLFASQKRSSVGRYRSRRRRR